MNRDVSREAEGRLSLGPDGDRCNHWVLVCPRWSGLVTQRTRGPPRRGLSQVGRVGTALHKKASRSSEIARWRPPRSVDSIVDTTTMPYEARVFQVFIASPSDVQRERDLTAKVIDEWNILHSRERGVVLQPVRWETHSSPEMGAPPQRILNKANCRCVRYGRWHLLDSTWHPH